MKKLAIICIILAVGIICLISAITYKPTIETENQPLECDFPLPNTTHITDSYLNSSEDKNTSTTRPIHHTTTSYSYDAYDDSYDDAIGDDYYYDYAYYDDKYGDTWSMMIRINRILKK